MAATEEATPTDPLREVYAVQPLAPPPDAIIRVPGSKSITNRALLIAALADGRSVLEDALFSDDTDRMADSLRKLGIQVQADPAASRFEVEGLGGHIPASSAELFIGNAGTACRFLCAAVALGKGVFRLDGVPRMRRRPIQPLLDALVGLGTDARSLHGTGCPPVEIRACGMRGGEISMPGDASSQYFSALLQVGPLTELGMTIRVGGEMVSRPYIDLTARVMSQFGVTMSRDEDYRTLTVPGGQRYSARHYQVEPDLSTASYFFAAAAATGGRVTVTGVREDSPQGDIRLLDVLRAMGCDVEFSPLGATVTGPARLRGVRVDATAFSDMAQTLYALAPFADGVTEVRGVAHSRLQECDRVSASATELRRLGQEVEEFQDGLRITPRPIRPATVQTYDDHRMAMAFAVIGLRVPGITIADPGCTAKTFPGYWDAIASLQTAGPAR